MKFLVIGGGAREHALAWKLAQSPRVSRVFVAPGNAGTAEEEGLTNVAITAIPDLVEFARQEQITITVVGPEAPLADGVADAFRLAELKIFGPNKLAAQLESSKDFAKWFMTRHRIPTAAFATFTEAQAAHDYVALRGEPIVIKADGLAAGKGVVVAGEIGEAHAAIDIMLTDGKMGTAGSRVVIEEFLEGDEASFIAMCDGKNVLPLATSQDHKRLRDGDAGPNTGGMGAYSPAPVITPRIHARIMREVIDPVVTGMEQEGMPFQGFLYAGLMITKAGDIRVLEFNCRMGDPEAEPILLRLKSDFALLVEHSVNGTLDRADTDWDRRVALGVVLAAHGYPDNPRKGDAIEGLAGVAKLPEDDFHVFHGGTAAANGKTVVNGGRVLCVTALGDNVRLAQRRAYQLTDHIHFDGMQLRRDIGSRALKARKHQGG